MQVAAVHGQIARCHAEGEPHAGRHGLTDYAQGHSQQVIALHEDQQQVACHGLHETGRHDYGTSSAMLTLALLVISIGVLAAITARPA